MKENRKQEELAVNDLYYLSRAIIDISTKCTVDSPVNNKSQRTRQSDVRVRKEKLGQRAELQ